MGVDGGSIVVDEGRLRLMVVNGVDGGRLESIGVDRGRLGSIGVDRGRLGSIGVDWGRLGSIEVEGV